MPDNSLPAGNPSFFQRFRFWLEYRIMLDMVGQEGPGPAFRWIFKMLIPLYHLGLWHLAGPFIMLVHKGRKTGKTRYTPLEYSYEPETDSYLLMAGWRGHTDWYRNLRVNPHVHAQVGHRAFDALAEPMSDEESVKMLKRILTWGHYEENPDHYITAQAVEAACWMAGGSKDYPEHFKAGIKPHSVGEK